MSRKRPPKHILRTIHLWLGLTSGLLVFVVALTGALYVFEEEGRELFQHHYYHVASVPAAWLSLDQLKDSVTGHFPGEKITSIRFKGGEDAALIFHTSGELISVDPGNGTILGVRNKDNDFFTVVEKVHTELYLGKVGKEIVKWNVLLFFILCLTGLCLWFPKKFRYWKHALKLGFRTKNRKLLIWNLHTVFGFYAFAVLLLISMTGLFWSFDAAKAAVALVTTGSTEVKDNKYKVKAESDAKQFSLEQAYRYAISQHTGKPTESIITVADQKNAVVRIAVRYPCLVARRQNTFFFNANDGALIAANRYDHYSAYDKVAMSNYNLHTGRIGGLGWGSKIIYFMAALIAASLPVTGFLIWQGKRRKSRKRIKAAPVAA